MSSDNSILNSIKRINPNITIREGQEIDADQFIQLMNSHYKRIKTKEYFVWQFLKTPFPSRLFVACDKDKIIGFCGIQIKRLSNGMRCGVTIDLFIDPAYRNRGIFYLLEDAVNNFAKSNNAVAIVTFPNSSGINAHVSIRGWEKVGEIYTWELLLDEFLQATHNQMMPQH